MPELEQRLYEHLRLGAVLAVVSATDSALQRRSSRILLRHSPETVQTHEFTPQAHADRRR
jgi:hypothetical protein